MTKHEEQDQETASERREREQRSSNQRREQDQKAFIQRNEREITTASQRRVNLIWETTQGAIALSITLAVVFTAVKEIYSAPLTNAFFLVVGFYFSRTNHSSIGGIGPKPHSRYMGR